MVDFEVNVNPMSLFKAGGGRDKILLVRDHFRTNIVIASSAFRTYLRLVPILFIDF